MTTRTCLGAFVSGILFLAPSLCAESPAEDLLRIETNEEAFQSLQRKKEEALEKHVLASSSEDYVPVRLGWRGSFLEGEIRLKGDWTDQLENGRWAFRIKLKGDHRLRGMRKFSLHHPDARGGIHEWIYHRMLRKEGVIALRYEFVRLSLNGKDLGIYALEEHFSEELLEHNGRPEGPILKFNEERLWDDRAAFYPDWDATPTGLQHPFSTHIDAFQMNRIRKDSDLFGHFLHARGLMADAQQGKLSSHQWLDIQKWGDYLSVSLLTGSLHLHGLFWHNLRFYYNPVTARIEPIGFDANAGTKLADFPPRAWDGEYAMFLKDLPLAETHIRSLARLAHPRYLDVFFADIGAELARNLAALGQEDRLDAVKAVYSENQRYLDKMLRPSHALLAYPDRDLYGSVGLTVRNIQRLPIEVLALNPPDSSSIALRGQTILPGTAADAALQYQKIVLDSPAGDVLPADIEQGHLAYRILGTDEIRTAPLIPWPYSEQARWSEDPALREPNVDRFPFLSVDHAKKEVLIRPGSWKVEEPIVLPAGYLLISLGDTALDLTRGAGLLARGPVHLLGSEDHPIRLHSSDGTGLGIAVLSSAEPSLLEETTVEGIGPLTLGGTPLRGALTFYESPVRIRRCRFRNNRGGDALNIVRSDFWIDESLFEETAGDALDIDFSQGKITRSSFIRCGNDAIDLSGSQVHLEEILVRGAGNKGVSIGEASAATARGIRMEEAPIGIACKDLSRLELEDFHTRRCQTGLALYRKKPHYGPASASVVRWTREETTTPYRLEDGSELAIDGRYANPEPPTPSTPPLPVFLDEPPQVRAVLNDRLLSQSRETGSYTFLLGGHIYGAQNGSVYPAASLLAHIERLSSLDPRFVILLGDSVQRTSLEEIENLKTCFTRRLSCPVFNAVGNHDLADPALYREHFGRTYFSFRYDRELFLFVDGETHDGEIDDPQLGFLTSEIARFRDDPELKTLFVCMHRLLWAVEDPVLKKILPFVNGPEFHQGKTDFTRKILPMLKELEEKRVVLTGGDIGLERSFPLFYYEDPTTSVTYVATGIGDTERDCLIRVNVHDDAERNLVFEIIPLTEHPWGPIESYGPDFWKLHFQREW
jgi:hypothetical protein